MSCLNNSRITLRQASLAVMSDSGCLMAMKHVLTRRVRGEDAPMAAYPSEMSETAKKLTEVFTRWSMSSKPCSPETSQNTNRRLSASLFMLSRREK